MYIRLSDYDMIFYNKYCRISLISSKCRIYLNLTTGISKEIEYYKIHTFAYKLKIELVSVLISNLTDPRSDLDSMKNSLLVLTFIYNGITAGSLKGENWDLEDQTVLKLFQNLNKIFAPTVKTDFNNGIFYFF